MSKELQNEVDWLRRELRQREAKAAQERAERLSQEAAAADAKQKADSAAALAEDIERTRKGSWVSFRLDEAAARGDQHPVDPAALWASVPATGWPPGVSVDQFYFAGMPSGGRAVDHQNDSPLMKRARELGIPL